MKFMAIRKDGGPESTVTGLFIIEIKSLFSIVLLKFNKGSRDVYHSHAFNAISWYLRGDAVEHHLNRPSKLWKGLCWPKITTRKDIHKVFANKPTYCLTIRGPWKKTWTEVDTNKSTITTLTHGRKVENVKSYS